MMSRKKKVFAAAALLLSVAFFASSAMAEQYCAGSTLVKVYRDSEGHIIKQVFIRNANVCQLGQLD